MFDFLVSVPSAQFDKAEPAQTERARGGPLPLQYVRLHRSKTKQAKGEGESGIKLVEEFPPLLIRGKYIFTM